MNRYLVAWILIVCVAALITGHALAKIETVKPDTALFVPQKPVTERKHSRPCIMPGEKPKVILWRIWSKDRTLVSAGAFVVTAKCHEDGVH